VEILEILYALTQFCGCMLELFALGTGAGAGVAGYKAKKTSDARKEALAKGEAPPLYNPYWFLFVVLVGVAVFCVGLLFFKYSGALGN
jgi:hypothetical protein